MSNVIPGMNPNWPRWVFASASMQFIDYFNAQGIFSFVHSDDSNTGQFQNGIEFRLDGPNGKWLTRTEWDLYIEISLLITTMRDDKDAHILERYLGLAASALTSAIPIFRFGDDATFLEGCFTLEAEGREPLVLAKFGIVQVDLPVIQASANGHYKGRFINPK